MAALRREREEQEMFDITSGHRRNRLAAETENIHQETWNIVDDWRLVDESINGLKLSRSLREGSRIGAGTLVAVKPVQGAAFVLGNVRWVLRDDNATVTAGIQLYSGTPRHMAIKPDEKQEGKQPYKPGFILHAGELTNDLPHIVIPVGSFRIDRRLDMQIDKQVLPIRLTKLIDRGNDFELCAYALRNFSGT